MSDDLVTRLRAKRYVRERWVEPTGTITEPCDADDDGARAVPRNPDGAEAAAEITRLKAEIAAMKVGIAEYVGVHGVLTADDRAKLAALATNQQGEG